MRALFIYMFLYKYIKNNHLFVPIILLFKNKFPGKCRIDKIVRKSDTRKYNYSNGFFLQFPICNGHFSSIVNSINTQLKQTTDI